MAAMLRLGIEKTIFSGAAWARAFADMPSDGPDKNSQTSVRRGKSRRKFISFVRFDLAEFQ
jgi:hypothetical protein